MTIIAACILFIVGFILGYMHRGSFIEKSAMPTSRHTSLAHARTHQERLKLKAFHQSDSDRIRELSRLSSHQSIFYRLLQNTFSEYSISVKDNRFIVLDHDYFPIAIFEYREGVQAMKLIDQEDGLTLHLYKGLISADELKADLHQLQQKQKLRKN